MSPRRGRMPMTAKMIEAPLMNLVTAKIGHVSLLLTQEAIQREIRPSCFLKGFSQNGIFSPFTLFQSTGWNLYSCFWSTGVTEHKQVMLMGNIGKDLVLDPSHLNKPLFLVQLLKNYTTSSRS